MALDPVSTVLAAALFAPLVQTNSRYSEQVRRLPVLERATTERLVLESHAETEVSKYYLMQSSGAGDLRDLVYAQLEQYKHYQNEWDGPGSLAPSASSLRAAQQFLAALPGGLPLPVPMLSTSGEVGFYWDEESGYADISFDQAGFGSFFSRTGDGHESFEEGFTPQALNRAWYFAQLGEVCAPQARAA